MNLRAAAVASLVAVGAATASPAAAAVDVVEVFNNHFSPQQITVARGATLTWISRHGGHTITADDGRFSFPAQGTATAGDTFSWTFAQDETFSYHCVVHGPGMRGVVIVGAGSPPPPPPPEPPRRTVPSATYPTLTHALADAPPTTIIDLQPGTHRWSTVVRAPHVTIRGTAPSPADVVIDGAGTRATGLDVRAEGVTIQNLTVRRHGIAGISVDGVGDTVIEDVVASDNGAFGVRLRNPAGGAVRATSVSGSSTAGLAIQGCDVCDVVVDQLDAGSNGVGISIERAGSVVVGRSSITGNGAGIVLTGAPLGPRGVHVWGNTITDNVRTGGVGAGIWIDGGAWGVLQHNTVTGHRYGIVVTGRAGPSIDDRIIDNTVGASTVADLAWDGLGADVCFSGNLRPGGSPVSSDPPMAETIYSCSLPHTVGIPWPGVLATMAGV